MMNIGAGDSGQTGVPYLPRQGRRVGTRASIQTRRNNRYPAAMETRPSTYKPDYVAMARLLGAEGLTDRELAVELGVSRSTIFRWRAAHPDFAEATRLGKAVANERVERALYERAIGYEEEAVRVYFPAGAK